jgi:hypothetical protein
VNFTFTKLFSLKIPIFDGETQAAENSCSRLSEDLIFGVWNSRRK